MQGITYIFFTDFSLLSMKKRAEVLDAWLEE